MKRRKLNENKFHSDMQLGPWKGDKNRNNLMNCDSVSNLPLPSVILQIIVAFIIPRYSLIKPILTDDSRKKFWDLKNNTNIDHSEDGKSDDDEDSPYDYLIPIDLNKSEFISVFEVEHPDDGEGYSSEYYIYQTRPFYIAQFNVTCHSSGGSGSRDAEWEGICWSQNHLDHENQNNISNSNGNNSNNSYNHNHNNNYNDDADDHNPKIQKISSITYELGRDSDDIIVDYGYISQEELPNFENNDTITLSYTLRTRIIGMTTGNKFIWVAYTKHFKKIHLKKKLESQGKNLPAVNKKLISIFEYLDTSSWIILDLT